MKMIQNNQLKIMHFCSISAFIKKYVLSFPENDPEHVQHFTLFVTRHCQKISLRLIPLVGRN